MDVVRVAAREAGDRRAAAGVVLHDEVLAEAVRVSDVDGVAARDHARVRRNEARVDRRDRVRAGLHIEARAEAATGDARAVADEGEGVLRDDGDRGGRADRRRAGAGEVAGDDVELQRLVGLHAHAAVRVDVRVRVDERAWSRR